MQIPLHPDLANAVSAADSAKNEYYHQLQMAIVEQQSLLAPTIIDARGDKKPLHLAYKSLLKWLDQLEARDPYRLDLMGAEIVDQTPLETYLYQVRQRIPNFDQLDLWDQAGHIVTRQFENMTQLLERHAVRQLKAKDEKHGHTGASLPQPRAQSPPRRAARRPRAGRSSSRR